MPSSPESCRDVSASASGHSVAAHHRPGCCRRFRRPLTDTLFTPANATYDVWRRPRWLSLRESVFHLR
jgi:hypothetical protein